MLLSWWSMHRPPIRSGRCAVARALSEGGVKRDSGAGVWSCAPDARLRASQAGHAAATIANWNGATTDHDSYRMPQPARANSTSTTSSASTMRVDIRWFISSFLGSVCGYKRRRSTAPRLHGAREMWAVRRGDASTTCALIVPHVAAAEGCGGNRRRDERNR